MDKKFGKLRQEDLGVVEEVLSILKAYTLSCGLHGTSLWNAQYKDIDLIAFSQDNDISAFRSAIKELQEKGAVIEQERGDEVVGIDLDVSYKGSALHLSFVILL